MISYLESPLGFRHSPKPLVNNNTEIIFLSSTNPYTEQYDQYLLVELARDNQTAAVTILNTELFGSFNDLDDGWAGLLYIVYCQVFSSLNQ